MHNIPAMTHRSSRLVTATLALLLLLLTVPSLPMQAGGPIGAVGDRPIVWGGPVRLLLDRGMLFDNDSATTYDIIRRSIEAWDTISASTLRIRIEGYLPNDVRVVNDPVLSNPATINDGFVPIVIDDDGSITDAFIGAGASRSVNGFATPFSEDGQNWTDGRIVLNGSRSRNETGFMRTSTHECGHLMGLSHTQRTHRADYPLMNPFGGPLDAEDVLALIRLYPTQGALDARGSITGNIVDAEGAPLSGVNVLAVNLESLETFATLTDYFSGNAPRFGGPNVPRTGAYRFEALPPGTYYIRMEGVNPTWAAGSSVASYDPPINTEVIDDWYNGENESGAMHRDNVNEKVGVVVAAGAEVSGIDLVENDRTGLTMLGDIPSGTDRDWATPNTFQGVRIEGYAQRHTAPFAGSPVMVRFWVGNFPSLGEADLIVTLYNNQVVQGESLPGTPIGEVRIPADQLVSGLNYDVWLHEIAGLRFNENDVFHIGLSADQGGRLNLQFVEGQDNDGTSYLRGADEEWVPFPVEGNNGGMRSGRLKMETLYSPIRPGDNRVLIASEPESILFDPTEVDQRSSKQLVIANIGTRPMDIESVTISGDDRAHFAYDTVDLVGVSIAPGERITADVFYQPGRQGEASALLNINGIVSLPIAMSGTGTSPAVGRLLDRMIFGQTVIDSTRTVDTLVIHNRGDVSLVAKSPSLGGNNGFRIVSPLGDELFRPGDSLSVIIDFTPTEERGYDDEVIITFRPPRDTVRIAMTGRGVRELTDVPVVTAAAIGLELAVMPNVVSDRLAVTLRSDRSDALTLLFVDPVGRVIERRAVTGIRGLRQREVIETEHLPSGTCRLVVATTHGTVVRSVVVVR